MVKGDNDFSPSVKLSQLLIAPSGTSPPIEGSLPFFPWRSILKEYQILDSDDNPIPRWRRFDKDFLFMAEPDDESGNFETKISFRFFAL